MSKGPRIKPTVRQVIVGEAVKDRKKPRRQLMVELQNIIESMGEIVPAEETLEKLISFARNHPVSPLDEPWSLGSLAEHDIPPEALPVVMCIYEKRLRELEQHFTIREALWIARLHKTIDDPIFLERFASAYAIRDQIDWILDSQVNTRGFDFILLNYRNPERRAEVIEAFNRFPGYLNPFPSSISNEEVTKKLKQKGYDTETPGMELLIKHVAEVEKQALQSIKQARAQLEQKKPEELNKQEAQFLKWLKAKEANHERAHSQEVQE